jgi:hypothetical protein
MHPAPAAPAEVDEGLAMRPRPAALEAISSTLSFGLLLVLFLAWAFRRWRARPR